MLCRTVLPGCDSRSQDESGTTGTRASRTGGRRAAGRRRELPPRADETAAVDLYALAPEEFVAARDAEVAQARADGDRERVRALAVTAALDLLRRKLAD